MLFPKLLSFFKTPRPKEFDYKPRYYSEQKEYIDRIKEQINSEKSNIDASERAKARIQDRFRRFRPEDSAQYSGGYHAKRVIYLVIGIVVLFVLIAIANTLIVGIIR